MLELLSEFHFFRKIPRRFNMHYLPNIVLFNEDKTLLAVVPHEQLITQSLQVVNPQKQFKDWLP